MRISSLYIHIPFCRRKCNYCDFASRPPRDEAELANYISLLEQELQLYREYDLSGLRTVYLGGGTPSLLAAAEVERLLKLLPAAEEITLEANPETVDQAQLAAFRAAGINRLSFGVQSFDNQLLHRMGRCHSAAQAMQAVTLAKSAGFDNISIDLIFGLPGQSLDRWAADLEQAISCDVPHISLYGLTMPEGTPWGEAVRRGELDAPDDDLAADMLELAMDRLNAANIKQYEIANFARPGWESRHNQAYWQRQNYLGLGVAAASCLLNCRWSNYTTVEEYAQALAGGQRPIVFAEELTIEQVMAEAIFLGLRLAQGVDCAAFAAQYGVDPCQRYRRELRRLSKLGLLVEEEGCLRLTRKGLLLGEQVFIEFV